jgi:hypothetical protein
MLLERRFGELGEFGRLGEFGELNMLLHQKKKASRMTTDSFSY